MSLQCSVTATKAGWMGIAMMNSDTGARHRRLTFREGARLYLHITILSVVKGTGQHQGVWAYPGHCINYNHQVILLSFLQIPIRFAKTVAHFLSHDSFHCTPHGIEVLPFGIASTHAFCCRSWTRSYGSDSQVTKVQGPTGSFAMALKLAALSTAATLTALPVAKASKLPSSE